MNKTQKEIQFCECAVCRQGTLIAMKQPKYGTLVLICDDCESQWRSPSEVQSHERALVVESTELVVATEEDLRAAGWL
jgi:hypothetical protein